MGTTTNYSWEYADNGSDEDTWGTINTALFQSIDAQVKTIDDAAAKTADNETISGTWTFSNPVAVGAATTGGHALNRDTADARYVAAGGGWQYKTTTTIAGGSPETVTIDDTGTIFSGQTNIKLRFDLRDIEVTAASGMIAVGFQVSSDGGTTKVGGNYTSYPLPYNTSAQNSSAATLASDSSSFVSFQYPSSTTENTGGISGELIIYQDTSIRNKALARWDLVFEDLSSGDGVRVSGAAEFNVGGAINWIRFCGNVQTTGTPAWLAGGKIDVWIQEDPAA